VFLGHVGTGPGAVRLQPVRERSKEECPSAPRARRASPRPTSVRSTPTESREAIAVSDDVTVRARNCLPGKELLRVAAVCAATKSAGSQRKGRTEMLGPTEPAKVFSVVLPIWCPYKSRGSCLDIRRPQ